MRTPSLLLFLAATGCGQGYAVIAVDESLDTTGTSDLPGDSGAADDTGAAGTTAGTTTGTTAGTTDDTGAAGTTAEPDYSEWDDATLVVLEPGSGDFLPYGETTEFSAVVYDAAGDPTDFDAIDWVSDADSTWIRTGAAFSDDALDAGTHALTASARLPNGDRLAYTIGGVLVQSDYAGTYTGTLVVEGSYSGYSLGCSGAATLYVDVYGELAWGDANCLISIQGYDLNMDFLFDLGNQDGALTGEAALDLFGLFQVPITFDGALGTDGVASGDFAYDGGSFTVSGRLDVERISRETQAP